MTQSEFYNAAFLAVIPPVTQAYILKHSLPFAVDSHDADEHLDERLEKLEAIAEMADLLANKLTAYWKDTDEYLNKQTV